MRFGLAGLLGESWDRLVASDPGLGRLRMAAEAAVSMATVLAVEYAFASAVQASPGARLVAMLIGAVLSMMGSRALSGTGVWRKARTAAFFPVAMGLGVATGTVVSGDTDLRLAVFVVVMFVAVFVRRFGTAFFFYGFLGWMGYFVSSFLQMSVAALPWLMVAVLVATAWLLLLSVTVLRTNPRRVLRVTWRAYLARGRGLARACAELLGTEPTEVRRRDRWRRRLSARQAGLAEAALTMEAWSAERGALPEGWSGVAVRRRLLEIHQAQDRLAAATRTLAEHRPALTPHARRVTDLLARNDPRAARSAAEGLLRASRAAEQADAPGWWPALHLAMAALEILDLEGRVGSPPEVEDTGADFAATAPLMMGHLPGSPAVARDVPPPGRAWNPLARLDLTSRQAFQVSAAGVIAIVLGRAVSPTRYYWAVIAAFVVFTGTGTRSDTFRKGLHRVLGTLAGLYVSILLAHLTAGRTWPVLAVIIASVFFGFYLFRVSYAYLIFFITIMLGQLYTALHRFSPELLVLRLEETAIGAAAGMLVALLVTPLSTRDAVRTARDGLLVAVAELLTGAADRVDDRRPVPDVDARARVVDERARQLKLVARPLSRTLLGGARTSRTRHRLSLYAALSAQCRGLAVALHRATAGQPDCVAQVCRQLAEAATRLARVEPGRSAPSLDEPLARAQSALFQHSVEAIPADDVLRRLDHLHGTLAELAATGRGITAVPHPAPRR